MVDTAKTSWKPFFSGAVLAGLIALVVVRFIVPHPTVLADRPECPHDYKGIYDTTSGPALVPLVDGEVSISGKYTSVPEFHDCQRLIMRGRVAEGRGVSAVARGGGAAGRGAGRVTGAGDTPTLQRVYGALAALFLSYEIIEGGPPQFFAPTFQAIGLTAEPGSAYLEASNPSELTSILESVAGSQVEGLPNIVIPFIEVVSEGKYPKLGIDIGFNCLYLTRTTRASNVQGKPTPETHYGAFMVSLGLVEQRCGKAVFDGSMARTPLRIEKNGSCPAVQVAGAPECKIPAATRWDWDEENKTYLIGAPCDVREWCAVGPLSEFEPTPPAGSVVAPAPTETTIPGWYDQQYLADYSAGPGLTPSLSIGTVFPEPKLDERDLAFYSAESSSAGSDVFKTVAHVAISKALPKYGDRYGYREVPFNAGFEHMTTIALCFGDRGLCIPGGVTAPQCANPQSVPLEDNPATQHPWWARMTAPDGTAKYFCVTFRPFPQDFKMPGVVRWRWRINDETVWIPCPFGCCEADT